MPELPEVETVKNELMPHVLQRQITGITLFWERIVQQPSVEEFRSRVVGQRIINLTRRGKYLLFHLSSGEIMVMHLRMTGSLLLKPATEERFIRAVIHLNDGEIYFRDPRKFGVMWLVKNESAIENKLGPEPLEVEFTPEVLAQLLHNRTAPIKALLLDQSLIAGIGNMYADEALFTAGIHPLSSGRSLSQDRVEQLHHAIRQVLSAAIGNKGASVANYFRPGGELGTAHFEFKVAHRGGEPCFNCNTPIQRIPIRNRGSYFCPKCQPLPDLRHPQHFRQ